MKLGLALAVTLAATVAVAIPGSAGAAPNGSISGTVTEATVPTADVFVTVIGIVDTGFFGKGPVDIADGITDANGHYTVTGLPPSGSKGYWVCFVPDDWPFGAHDSQCFDQTDTFFAFPSGAGFLDPAPGSKAVSLTGGEHRTGVDADLQPPPGADSGGITGKVAALGLVPVRHVTITVDQGGTPAGATFSAGNGTYRVTGLAPGSYRVCFNGKTAGRYKNICRKALVTVRAGVLTKGINGALPAGR